MNRLLAVALGVQVVAAAASAATLRIDGSPLRIQADEYGTVGVQRWVGGTAKPQYYALSAKGSAVFLSGTNEQMRWGNGAGTFVLWDDEKTGVFAPLSHTQPDPMAIRTVLAAGQSGVVVTQELSYVNGASHYLLAWRVFNGGQVPLRDLRFVHGGDVSPGDEDFAVGAWDAVSNTVSAQDGEAGDFMGLRGDALTPATGYQEGHFQLVRDAAKSGALSGTVNGQEHDAAYALQWSRAQLNPGETWAINAVERFPGEGAATGAVQVTGPPPQAALAGLTVSNTFAVANLQQVADTFVLRAMSSAGWAFSFPSGTNLSLAAWATSSVPVRVTVPAGAAAGTSNVLTLTAASVAGSSVMGSAAAVTIVSALPVTSVWQDVTGRLQHPLLAGWALSRQTGTYFGTLTIKNVSAQPMTGPFVLAIQSSTDMRFVHPTGTLADGRSGIDVTAAVLAAQADGRLDPQDSVAVSQIEVYMKYRTDPPDSAFSLWATAPAQ
jgi:hypothetical protein